MPEIDLSIFNRGENGVLVQAMLDEFEKIHKVRVNLQLLDWEDGWTKLIEVALYGHGPDISEVGSTWVMDFVRMHVASNLFPAEVARMVSEKDFFPTNWESGISTGSIGQPPLVWAIPWTSDIRVAYYRRDVFKQANLNPSHTFSHIEPLSEAIRTLKATGTPFPVALSTLRSRINLHVMASWIWDAGGDFITADGKQVTLNDPKAMRGMQHYFQLGKYMLENRNRINDHESDDLFLSGEAAVTFSGPWIPISTTMPAATRDNLGMMAMPGASFVGGTHLLTWKHTRNREMTLALIDFLVKRSAEFNIFPAYGLPAYVPGWEKVHFIAEPYFSTLLNALQKGRSFPNGQLWGLVEKRLVDAIPIIWEKVLNTDEKDIAKILSETIVPLTERINTTLE